MCMHIQMSLSDQNIVKSFLPYRTVQVVLKIQKFTTACSMIILTSCVTSLN